MTRIKKYFPKASVYITSTVILFLFINSKIDGATSGNKNATKFRTNFGSCPSRTVGTLALKLMKSYESKKSLRSLKQIIVKEKLESKYFLSDYSVRLDPLKKELNFKFDCPEPLMKVQIYKKNGLESYDAILVDTGELFDPTYEVLLRAEQKLKDDLPFLAIPVGDMNKDSQKALTRIVKSMNKGFRSKLSEVIINDDKELTVILSVLGRPSSAFLGNTEWDSKVSKLQKLISFMEKKRKIPAVINLTNSKKVVVKFRE